MAGSEVERVGRTATAGLPPDLPPLQELVWRRLRRRGVTPPGPSGFNEGSSSSHNPGSPTGPGSDLAPTVADLSQSRSSQRGSNHLSYMVDQVWSLTHFYSLKDINIFPVYCKRNPLFHRFIFSIKSHDFRTLITDESSVRDYLFSVS